MTIQLSRRTFFAGAAVLGLTTACAHAGAGGQPFSRIGVQLYTVRDAFNADPLGTLKKVREIGFDEVETAGLGGKSARELRAMLDQTGLTAASGHGGHEDWFSKPEAVLDDLATLGAKYAVLAWLAPERRNSWKALADDLNKWGELARARGLTMAYHNHEFEFEKGAEGMPMHILFDNTDPALVTFELDCYWASFAGHDPVHVLEEHGSRIRLLHLKDKTADGQMAAVGQGTIDYAKVLRKAREVGVTNVFVEHDNPSDAFASITASLKHLKG